MPLNQKNTAQPRFEFQAFLHPMYWPTWLAIGIAWSLAQLPLKWQWQLGAWIGNLAGWLIPSRRRVVDTNLSIAFADMPEGERRALGTRALQNVGMALPEIGSAWFKSSEWMDQHTEWFGTEHVECALASGRGVLLTLPHFSSMELAGAFLSIRYQPRITSADAKNRLFAAFQNHQRIKRVEVIPRDDLRAMLRVLRAGEMLWYSPDQSARREHGGVETQFFGHPVLTVSGTGRIAKASKALVVPFYAVRNREKGVLEMHFGEALEDYPCGDHTADTQRINDLFESWIRAYPDQYLWAHKRFKPFESDMPNPYRH